MRVKPPDLAFFRRKTQQSRAVYLLQCSLQLANRSPTQSGMLHLLVSANPYPIHKYFFYKFKSNFGDNMKSILLNDLYKSYTKATYKWNAEAQYIT